MNNPDDLTPEELEELARNCLAEVLNAAAQIAELQTDDAAYEEIYAMCDLVAAYYAIERTPTDEPLSDTLQVPGKISTRRLGQRWSVGDSDK